jgi:hypothetical protein
MTTENNYSDFFELLRIVVPAIVSVLTVSVTLAFSKYSDKNKQLVKTDEENYLTFHVPLIKRLASFNPDSRAFFDVIIVVRMNNLGGDLILDHFITNIQFVPETTIDLVFEYFKVCGDLSFYNIDSNMYQNSEYEKIMIEASTLYDQIILNTLKESSKLSKKLGYPDISTPILESFLNELNADESNRRHLSALERRRRI